VINIFQTVFHNIKASQNQIVIRDVGDFRHLTFGTVATGDLSLFLTPQSDEEFSVVPTASRSPVRLYDSMRFFTKYEQNHN
jgi:hypothetical protein